MEDIKKNYYDIRRECRFYACILIGAALIFCGCFIPPIGIIDNSVIIGSGLFLCIGALAVGIDIKGCLEELVKLKSIK